MEMSGGMIHSELEIFEDDKGIPVAEMICLTTGESIFFSKGSQNDYLLIAPGLENTPWIFWTLSKEDRERFARWLLE